MNKLFSGVICLFLLFPFYSCNTKSKIKTEDAHEKREGQRERLERDIMMMKDPALGIVPSERLLVAKEFKDHLMQSQSDAVISGITWRQLGPKNQGGRSRAVLVDANDATGNTVWVGSVGGGLWRTTNINAVEPNWTPINDFFDNLAITSLVQDPSNTQVMYFCTGEKGYGNQDAIRGFGVWKSTDGGANWLQLPSTVGATFNSCQRMAVSSTGIVYVATAEGLQRSTNGGTNWNKVLGNGLGITGANSDLCYDVDIDALGNVYGTLSGSIHKSVNAGATFNAAFALGIAADRIEVACALSDPNYVYALIENGNVVNGIIQSTNGGSTWTSRVEPTDADPGIPADDFSRGQAWYDLTIAVDPNNRDVVFVGGVDLFKSIDGCATWSQIAHWYGGFGFQNVHADQHYILFKPGSSTEAYFVNDGGIYKSTNANAAVPAIANKGANYITAQFYSCAMHPTAQTNHFLAGAQDNGSHKFTQDVLQNTTEVTGGDGAFVHIDQNEPQYQFTSYIRNNYYRSTDGGNTWTGVDHGNNGRFINPTDYDNTGNILYAARGTNEYLRWDDPQSGNTFTVVPAASFGGQVSAVTTSPNTANRVFFGANGDVFKVDNANTATPTITNISTSDLPVAYLNCIEVQTGNDNHILLTYTNYGVTSIWETTNGGTTWTSVEGNLPDMPIRWALFNPSNSDQAVIATELGVWSTDDLNGTSTVWGASNSGLANVRVDMLQIRTSDKVMIAATHGRGLFLSTAFANPSALFTADKVITYSGVPINFTSTSLNATSWSWNFGDATTSTAENPTKTYPAAGRYTVTLTINSGASTLTKTQYIHILPNRGTPYTPPAGGNFDTNPNDFGVNNTSGTPWERGNSTVAGKNGTTSGSFAWVTGLTGNYVIFSDASLMTPNYNFTTMGTYTMRFQSKMDTETGYDGFRVEYTLDSGRSWSPLGTTVQANWYNFANTSGATSFPVNQAFFTGSATTYTLYSYDMTFLQGKPSVAFRIRFKSDFTVVGPGVALDDFEIRGPINIVLAVTLTNFTANKQGNNVTVNWRTQNEIDIDKYVVERSFDGQSFTSIGTITAKNQFTNAYNFIDNSVANNAVGSVVYYRLKISERTGRIKYSEVAKVNFDKISGDVVIAPNPVNNYIGLTTNEPIKLIQVIDATGKIVLQTANILGNKVYLNNKLANGSYVVKVTLNSGKIVTKQIMKI